jgi:PAS domain S-box-containing protein
MALGRMLRSGVASDQNPWRKKAIGALCQIPESMRAGRFSLFQLSVDLGLGAALAIFLGASFAAYHLASQAVQAASEARESMEALALIQELLTSLVDAETGQRGYLLTGDRRYLDPYSAALPQVQEYLAAVRAAKAHAPSQKETIERLGGAVNEKLSELALTLALSRSSGIGAAREVVATDRGRVAMEDIRALAQDIGTQERLTLRARNDTAAQMLETARRVMVGGVLVNLFVLLGISLVTHREIRTRERAEEALESANAQAKEVLDASTRVSIIATDLWGRVTLFNRGAEMMLGYRAAELVGRESLLVLHVASELEARGRELGLATGAADSGFGILTAPIRREVPEERDWTYVRKDGTELSVTLSVTPKHDRQGVLSGYLAIALDVSEQHRVDRRQAVQHAATQALGESVTLEDAIPKALEALGRRLGSEVLGFWTVDRGSKTLLPACFWSASERGERFVAACGTLSFASDEDLPGRVWASGAPVWCSDLSREPSFSRASAASAAGLRTGFACPVALGGDVLAVIEIWGEKKEEHDPLLLEVLSGIGTQIAQFMERDAADRARRAGDERTKAIVENMLEGLVVVNNRSLIVSANRAAERMFGYESWELLGQHLSLLMPVRGTASEAEASLKDARLRSVGRITEWKGRRKNGDLFPFELSLYEFDTPEGRLFAGHVRDISERLRLDRMKKEFVANVSHELRTPLTSIRGSLSLLSSGVLGDLPDEARDVVAIAERNTLRLIALINDILDLERLESGQLETQIAPTSLRTVAERSIDAVSSFADAQNIFLTSSVPEVEVMGDGDRLVQVLVNLLSNAVKFSERDSSVELTAEVGNGTVVVRVADHGRGIPPDAIGRLFQRFHQVEASDARQKGGTGLGLAICKGIVEQHGGEIGVESEIGHGSTFWFRVPTAPHEGSAATPPTSATADVTAQEPIATASDSLLESLRHEGLGRGQPDVLLVDDDQALLGILARQFLASGHAVRVASTAPEAIAMARALPPRLIVLDLDLPEGSGFDVVATLRENETLQDTPLLVYAGRDLSGEDRRRLRLGRTRFLTKSKATDEQFHQAALSLLGDEDAVGASS